MRDVSYSPSGKMAGSLGCARDKCPRRYTSRLCEEQMPGALARRDKASQEDIF